MSASLSRRAAYERTRKRRSIAVATVSSLTVVAAIVLFVPRMPRWDRVKESFFSGERFADSFLASLRHLYSTSKYLRGQRPPL